MMENTLKVVFFFEILMKFCRNFTNMLRMSRIFNFLKKKDPIFRKIRENFGNVEIIQKIIQNYSVVSLDITRRTNDAQGTVTPFGCPVVPLVKKMYT